MNPTISQQIQAIKLRIEETIIPELKEDAIFAREQAAFIVMSLNWLMQTHSHQYRYEVVENLEYRNLIKRLASIGVVNAALLAEINQATLSNGPLPDEAIIPLDDLAVHTRKLKQLTAELFNSLCGQSDQKAEAARKLLQEVSVRQGDREQAFFEGTGFTSSPNKLGYLLGESSSKRQPA